MPSLKEGLNIIDRTFGQSDNAKTLTKILRNSVKLTRSREQCNFLMCCRRLGLIPIFILNCVKLPSVNNECTSSFSHVQRFHKAMLNDGISNLHGRIAFFMREARRSPQYLQALPGHHHGWFLKLCVDICRQEAWESSSRLQKKLNHLTKKQKTSVTQQESNVAARRINNVSSHSFSDSTMNLLSKGPKFAVTQKVNNKTLQEAEVGLEKMAFSLRWKRSSNLSSLALPSTATQQEALPATPSTSTQQLALPAPPSTSTQQQAIPAPSATSAQQQVLRAPPTAAVGNMTAPTTAPPPATTSATTSSSALKTGRKTELIINFPDTPKSKPQRADPATEDAMKNLKHGIMTAFKKKTGVQSNVSAEEARALRTLKQSTDVIIKASDKCQRFVIMDKTQYLEKAKSMLQNQTDYTRVDRDPTASVQSKVQGVMHNLTNLPEAKSLTPTHSVCPVWYGLPKDHKKGIPLRPIVSNCSSPTEKPSYIVERILTQLLKFVPTHLQSSTHFLKNLANKYPSGVPANAFMFTMDVSSLYTNIPINDAIPVISDMVLRHISEIDTFGLTVKEIDNLLTLCLQNSFFRLDGDYFLQNSGVAMGNKMGPPVAILFMHSLEQQLSTHLRPDIFMRYIDDYFGVWTQGEGQFVQFQQHINSIYPSIKLTTTREDVNGSIPFLDILLTRHADNTYNTELYIKDTHSGISLHYQSAHPRITKENTLKNELRRAIRLSSTPQAVTRSINRVIHTFRNNGYPSKLIFNIVKQVKGRHKYGTAQGQANATTNATQTNKQSKTDRTYITLPFVDDDLCRKVERLVRTSGLPCIVSWVNKGSLKRQLTSSDLRGPACPIKRGVCIPCKSGFDQTCATNNAVYQVKCNLCAATYVGECIRPVRERFFDHRRAAFRKDINNPVGLHFQSQHGYDVIPEVPISGKILCKCHGHVERKVRETMFIRELKPVMNKNVASWPLLS